MQIVWLADLPEEQQTGEIFYCSVDGVHCRIREPKHETLKKNPKWYSHKTGGPGVNYELAISVFKNKLISISKMHKASVHDMPIFEAGIKDRIPEGRMAVADDGYAGDDAKVARTNSHHTPEVRKFIARARARHESFNGRIKFFAVLDNTYRHGVDTHEMCFVAVCVIVQMQIENGMPLFNV